MIGCDTHDKLEMLWIESQHENNLIRTLINRLLVMVMRVMSFALTARVLQKLMHDGVDGGDGTVMSFTHSRSAPQVDV